MISLPLQIGLNPASHVHFPPTHSPSHWVETRVPSFVHEVAVLPLHIAVNVAGSHCFAGSLFPGLGGVMFPGFVGSLVPGCSECTGGVAFSFVHADASMQVRTAIQCFNFIEISRNHQKWECIDIIAATIC